MKGVRNDVSVTFVMLLLLATGCAGAAGSATPGPTGDATGPPSDRLGASPTAVGAPDLVPTRPPSLPVDGSLIPVSRSHPSAEALTALEACGAKASDDPTIERVAELARASDVVRFVPGLDKAPQITSQSDQPAWVVQFVGEQPHIRAGEIWVDEVCVVIGGQPAHYRTGPARSMATGKYVADYYERTSTQTSALPTLAP